MIEFTSPAAYAEVVLPFQLQGTFTYALPPELAQKAAAGKRVVVQFGARRIYAALVVELHHKHPMGYKAKEVLEVLDEQPVVSQTQLKFWEWMAGYYMCSLGEVLNAALPAALKLDSETRISLHEDWVEGSVELSEQEFAITEVLRYREEIGIKDIQKLLDKQTVYPVVKALMDKQVTQVREQLGKGFRPKLEKYIRLSKELEEDEEALDIAADSLKRAPKQMGLLETYLRLSEDGEVLKAALVNEAGATSSQVKQLIDKGVFLEYTKEVDRLSIGDIDTSAAPTYLLTEDQQRASSDIDYHFKEGKTVLLHGVTSSGKTLIYIEQMRQALAAGKQVLYLLPEIALTGQIIRRLAEHFGDSIGVYHSKFNDNERVEVWNKVKNGECRLLIGVRSSVFLPFKELGLVIVDEEHDNSYKQYDPAPRYNARDAAIYLSTLFHAHVLLGSATPSLESYHNTEISKYGLVKLLRRYGGVKLPDIDIVNIADERKKRKMKSHFSSVLMNAMEAALKKKEQIILFQNRRGYAPYLMCLDCSWVPKCKNCDVSLTYHKYLDRLKCHYCGYSIAPVKACEDCGSTEVRIMGFGTEKIEDELRIYFPDAGIARLDLESTRTKHAHEQVIGDFEMRKTDILVGTQMVTKGLDFDNVTLVGILSADQLINFPDFRSHERAYQLMEQVSGRAGRKEKPGKVVIQATHPDHHILNMVVRHDYDGFYLNEVTDRRSHHYPPFFRLILITLRHRDREMVIKAAKKFVALVHRNITGKVLGPVPPVVGRVRNLYLQDVLIKMPKSGEIMLANKHEIYGVIAMLKSKGQFPSVQFHIDVDP